MRRILLVLVGLGILGAAAGLWLTRPQLRDMAAYEGLTPDPAHGAQVFWAAGCASCHMAPEAKGEAQLVLAGGQAFPSAFGTFIAPNISPDPTQGIGGWSLADFVGTVQDGVTPGGEHVYPALPYAAYAKMEAQDVVDLKAYMDTLPPDPTPSQPHQVGFPFNIRLAVGGWKLLFWNRDFYLQGELTPEVARGRYIAEAMAHCTECHTPRNILGGLQTARWLGGAPNPTGKGMIPNITPGKLTWSEGEIVEFLTSGFTPDFDSVGGHMAHVVENMARLPESDRQAVAAYLKAIPAVTE
jgi:mono/diheme cytochrome c family protein